jgi:glyoxylate carboligase
MNKQIEDQKLLHTAQNLGFDWCIAEARLALFELLIKAGAGYSNSHTEEVFLKSFGLMKTDRTPNKIGRKFIMEMGYASSNKKAKIFYHIKEWRNS